MFLENEFAIIRYDDFPVSNGHLEVITKRHVKDWQDTTTEERISLFNLLDEAKKIIDNKFKSVGYNIGMNLGEKAGQTIMHLHICFKNLKLK